MRPNELLLYGVTDRAWIGDSTLSQQVKDAIDGGATIIQLREKNLSFDEFLKEAIEIKKICAGEGVKLLINDNIEIAKASGADGVHLGQSDMPCSQAREILGENAIIGISARTVEQALKAQRDGADYLGSGAAFTTSTKPDANHISKETLRSICKAVDIPVVAIGGINENNIKELAYTGISGVAVVSSLFAKKDIKAAAQILRQESEKIAKKEVGKVLTIAGSDSSGGAGIQADIKTVTAFGMYAMSAITALTSQNTTGVYGIFDVSPEFVASQIDRVFEDIRPDSVKIGMVSNSEIIKTIAERLKFYHAENIVVDPVMVSTSGSRLITEDAGKVLVSALIPMATLITPNIPEAEIISGMEIKNAQSMERAAKIIQEMTQGTVLLKGGHSINDASDYLYDGEKGDWLNSERIDNPNTHGTGCTLSSAIACGLAGGKTVLESVKDAKEYLTGAIKAGLDLGRGSGPLEHFYKII